MKGKYYRICEKILESINAKIKEEVTLGYSNGELYVYTKVDGGNFHAPFESHITMRKPAEMALFLMGVEAGLLTERFGGV